jgi:hypothetical protein
MYRRAWPWEREGALLLLRLAFVRVYGIHGRLLKKNEWHNRAHEICGMRFRIRIQRL